MTSASLRLIFQFLNKLKKKKRQTYRQYVSASLVFFFLFFFFIREPHIFSVYVTHSILSLFISFFVLKGGRWWLVTTCAGELLIESLPATCSSSYTTHKKSKEKKKDKMWHAKRKAANIPPLLVVAVARCQLSTTRPLFSSSLYKTL
jgi:hypothetical protein